jgi:hypothetical protein
MIRTKARHGLALVVTGLLVASNVVFGVRASAAESDAERKIRAELAKPTQIEFNETQLKDALDYLEQLHGINIEISEKKLEDAKVPLDAPVTKVLKGVSLKSALNLILGELNLSYVIENQVLLITSAEYARSGSQPEIYDVARLILKPGDEEALQRIVELVLDPPAPSDKDGEAQEAKKSKPVPRMVVLHGQLVLRASSQEHENVSRLLERLKGPAGPFVGASPLGYGSPGGPYPGAAGPGAAPGFPGATPPGVAPSDPGSAPPGPASPAGSSGPTTPSSRPRAFPGAAPSGGGPAPTSP